MITKERTVPLKLKKLDALIRRLPGYHPLRPKIEEEWAKSRAGYRGEQSIDYHLQFFHDKHYLILHGLRIPIGENDFFQIDTLILSPRYILVLEVKNISGTLYFDQTFHQLIRILNKEEEAFPDPILQVKRQKMKLKQWLQQYKFPDIPIVPFVVISNPSSIIKTDPQHISSVSQIVIRASILQTKAEQLNRAHQKEIYSMKEMRKLSRLLIKNHSEHHPDLLQKYQISISELLTGVQCQKCLAFPMQRKRGTWFCMACSTSDHEAHCAALKDYCLLIGTAITNQQLRHFLQLSSASVATKLLKGLNLDYAGTLKNREYQLPFLD